MTQNENGWALAHDPARLDELVLVDVLDRPLGTATKEQAHTKGLLHRAFSVVITREHEGETQVLLARRASCKYHCGGLWGNSCCSHPRVGEDLMEAASRRVTEELGCAVRDLREIGSFVYRADFANGLTEYEFDHVLVGRFEGELAPPVDEVDVVWWISLEHLARVLTTHSLLFAPWARTVLPLALNRVNGDGGN